MAQIATTIEQSKKLIELGLSADTADMYYNVIVDSFKLYNDNAKLYVNDGLNPNVDWKNVFSYDKILPAWSLSALLGLIKPVNENTYTIQGTLDGGAIISFEEVTSVAFQEDNILDAVFEMLVYLLKNKLI